MIVLRITSKMSKEMETGIKNKIIKILKKYKNGQF